MKGLSVLRIKRSGSHAGFHIVLSPHRALRGQRTPLTDGRVGDSRALAYSFQRSQREAQGRVAAVQIFRMTAAAICMLLLLVTVPKSARADVPLVTSISGATLRIDAGQAQGVAQGTSGKVYRFMRLGGEEKRIEVARVEVVGVLAGSAILHVVEQGTNTVQEGDLVELPGVAVAQDVGNVRATLDQLLERAMLQMADNRLTSPQGDNAFETLSEVLARVPENEDAQSLLSDIAGQYVSWGESALARGDLSKARGHVTKALRVQPGHAGALGLRGRVEAKAAETLRRLEREGLVNSIGVRLKRIPAGSFQMGSPSSEHERDDDERTHRVTLSRAFFLGVTEVTQAQWRAVMGNNPSRFSGDDRPVEMVSWSDAVEFCNRLSEREGLRPAYRVSGDHVRWNESEDGYRLPTEAEWEYACRAGTASPFSFGNDITPNQVNYDGNFPYRSGREGRVLERTEDVGSFPANGWGMHEMQGNVWEWCWDWYGSYPSNSVTDPTGPQSGSFRVLRGGSWYFHASNCRSANRNSSRPDYRFNFLGFRVARSAP